MTGVPAWSGPFLLAVAVLLTAAVAKLADPRPTALALRAAGLPVAPSVVRAGAAAELAVALLAVTGSAAGAALLAATYAAFGAFVAVALRRRTPLRSCGCLGKADTPPSRLHLALDAGAAMVGMVAAAGGGLPVVEHARAAGAGPALAFVALLAVGTYACHVALAVLPLARPR